MKKFFSDEQIISTLREAEAGISVWELCRRHAIYNATFPELYTLFPVVNSQSFVVSNGCWESNNERIYLLCDYAKHSEPHY